MKYLILGLLFLLQWQVAFSHPAYRPRYKKSKGFLVTTENDTIKGYFYVNYFKGVLYNKDVNLKGAYKRDSVLQTNNLKSIFLELKSEKVLNLNGLIEYDYLTKYNRIYRKIYSGKNDYYDDNVNSYNVDKIFNMIVVLKTENSESLLLDDSDFKSAKKKLIDYLNKKYSANFEYKDFENPIQVIQEIEKHL